MNFTDGKICR